MDDREITDHSSVEERRQRRRRLRRRARTRDLVITGALILVIFTAVLFSPIGPFADVLFPESEPSEQGETAQLASDIGPVEEAPVEPEVASEIRSGSQRVEKVSDPAVPAVAIVVDDTGVSTERLQEWLEIDAAVTFAALPYCAATPEVAEQLYAAGFRIMLHIPTENDPPNSFSATGQLAVGMDRAAVFSTLDGDLAQVPRVSGINNHQGGRGCNDLALMTYMCEWAAERGLFVMDSNSSAASQVTGAAESLGMPRRKNQVFIDHDNDPDRIRAAMRRLADIARRDGTAIGICHFARPNTARTVGEMIRTLEAEGINFAFVQDIHN